MLTVALCVDRGHFHERARNELVSFPKEPTLEAVCKRERAGFERQDEWPTGTNDQKSYTVPTRRMPMAGR